MKGGIRFGAVMALSLFLGACTINKDLLFKTPTGYEYDVPPEQMDVEYRIQPYDLINFRLYSNDGFLLIDLTSGSAAGGGSAPRVSNIQNAIRYRVEVDGEVKLPTLGHT